MAIILLIRHGENDWVGKKLAGRLPGVHLNQNGLNQAKALAATLKNLPFKTIYSSPLERAMETAQPLADIKKMEISICENLSEINFGDWQGKTIKQMRRLKLWETVQNHPSQMQFPNGESFIDAQKRLVDCITQISEKYEPTDLIACFSHSDAIRLLVAHYLNVTLDSFQRIHINTASITMLMLTDEHISVPFVNLIDINKFTSQFIEVKKKPTKKNPNLNEGISMTKILLIRHGDTDYVDEALAGRIDSPLNTNGLVQSFRVAEALKHLPIDAIYASPLKRTQETAEPLAKFLKQDVKINNELNQVNFGDWQGLSFDELIQDPEWKIFQENPALAMIPGGEDGFMVRERVSTGILKLIDQYPQHAVIAIYSHGSIIRHTISYFIGLPLEHLNQIRIAPASISTLAISENKGKLLHLNQELPVFWL